MTKDDCLTFTSDVLSDQLQKQACEVSEANEVHLVYFNAYVFKLSYACKWGSCCSSFSTRTGLATHIAAHLDYFLQSSTCPKKQKLELRCHWRGCTESASNFGDVKLLARHLSSENHVGQMPFVPKINGITINKDYKEELPHTKSKKVKRFPCSFPGCGKVFNDSSNRKKHEKTHDANRERYHCPENGCNKSYSTRTDLNIHLKVHKGEFSHKCSYPACTKAFVRVSELYAHEVSESQLLSLTYNSELTITSCRMCAKNVVNDFEKRDGC